MNLNYSGVLLETKTKIETLLNNIPYLELATVMNSFNSVIDSQSIFSKKYPLSSKLIRSNFNNYVEQVKDVLALKDLQANKYQNALRSYEQLLTYFNNSHSLQYAYLRDSCMHLIRRKVEQDSLENLCNKIINKSDEYADKTKAVNYLNSMLLSINGCSSCVESISQKISALQKEIEIEKERAEYNHEKTEDEKALERYEVDADYNQIDLFKNPFGLKGKYITIKCSVVKFTSSKSALMNGGETFYADFKVKPPIKYRALYLLVKVKGVTALVNDFGTPINVPYVDVVYMFNHFPEK